MLAGAFYLGLGALDFSLLLEGNEVFHEFWNIFDKVLTAFNLEFSFASIAALVFYVLCSWLCAVTTAYLADVISSSLLNGRKGNLAITFVLFILINYAVQKILTLVPDSLGVVPVFLLQGGIALVLAGIMYVITARLMDRYLSV